MNTYPKEFFQLQTEFALFLAERHKLSLADALFRNTAFYVRIIGHSDEKLPDSNHPIWQELMTTLPSSAEEITEHFYKAYLAKEYQQTATDHTGEACFHGYYHKDKNHYELHLDNNDPHGILSKDRIAARTAELTAMFTRLKQKSSDNPIVYVRTWLLNVDAFTRLFPAELKSGASYWDSDNKTYDNTHWGQFLDRHRNFRHEMAELFKQKWEGKAQAEFNLYFPLPAKYSELPLSNFVEFYEA